jgi:hypothetical protein
MNYYFVIRTDELHHCDVTPEQLNNYIGNISSILLGDPKLLMGIQTLDQGNDRERIVYYPRYTKVLYSSGIVSVATLAGIEIEDGNTYLEYVISYSNLDFYTILEDIDIGTVMGALLSTLASVE